MYEAEKFPGLFTGSPSVGDDDLNETASFQTSPVTQDFSLKPMSDFIFLFRFTSYGSEIGKVPSCAMSSAISRCCCVSNRSWPTWVARQVREGDRFTFHLVWETTQGHTDFDLLCYVLVLVGRSLKHDGNLSVHVSLGKLTTGFPRPSSENDLNVVCGISNDAFSSIQYLLVESRNVCYLLHPTYGC